MDAAMKIAVILTAFDKMSDVINRATDNAETKMRKLMTGKFLEGAALFESGKQIINNFVSPAVSAYAKLEDANTNLKASMLDATGAVDKNFEKVNKVAEDLGNLLPGTTRDFDEMFEVMMNNGVKSQSIIEGVGKAAAFLAVDLKLPYTVAGEFAARMKEATGVADKDMLKFMDTISRTKNLGVNVDEMRYSFARASGTLKMLGLQGLQSSNDMSVLFATLIRGGMSGETAATSFNNIIQSALDPKKWNKFSAMAKQNGLSFQLFDKDGKFMGVENMVAQFDKMKGLATTKKAELVLALTGGGGDAQALNQIINSGAAGYAKMRNEMLAKATLNDKINTKLQTLNSLWEATTGTIENMLAALGAGLGPILKPIVTMIGSIAGHLQTWFKENPRMAQFIMLVASLVGVFLGLLGAIKIIQGIRVAMQLLNLTMKANPFILFASIAILALSLIITNWDKIKVWFLRLWDNVKRIFRAAWGWIKNMLLTFTPAGLIFKYWGPITGYFSGVWQNVKNIFSNSLKWLMNLGGLFWNAGKNIILSIWSGMKSLINKPIEAVKSMVGKIRNLLPFSPAKEGPLRDIHKIRLVETIAESVKPNALINKMRNVAQLTFGVASGRSLQLAPNASTRGGNGPVSISITLQGGATKQDAKTVVDELEKRFPQLMKKYQGQQSRVGF